MGTAGGQREGGVEERDGWKIEGWLGEMRFVPSSVPLIGWVARDSGPRPGRWLGVVGLEAMAPED